MKGKKSHDKRESLKQKDQEERLKNKFVGSRGNIMKVGLMLGGGGVFGAYQVGVIRALIEEDLLSQIKVMSGSSIGAINILMLMAELSIDEIEELWTNLDNEMIFKR